MKIKQNTPDNESIGSFQEIKSTIATENLGLALEMVSKNLYSDPIGSFIREITSNAVDAHVDVNEQAPVLIEIYQEDDLYYIEFKDNGSGMTPEVFQQIYMSWFNSDKRGTNAKIGGWGLGSKSPLAYQDSFEIITRVDGTKWHYLLANAKPVPTSTLLLEEPTTQGNGTSIKIELKEDDLWKISNSCKSQLTYFDNVYVKNNIYYYDNTFKIYESDFYKLRNGKFPFGNKMHICLGQVTYPINFEVLGIDEIRIPVALKFNVGELDVTLSREEINYTERVKEKIISKAKIVQAKILEQYEEQLKVDDFFEYIRLVKSSTLPPFKIKDVEINLDIESEISFTPFEGVKIRKEDINVLFSSYGVARITNGKKFELHSQSYNEYYRLHRYPQTCYLVEDKFSHWDIQYIENGYLFKKHKITSRKFKDIATLLGLTTEQIIKDEYGYILQRKRIIKLGASKLIYKVLKYVTERISETIQSLQGQAPDYWIEERKEEQRIKKEETKGEITHYSLHNNRRKVKLKELVENNKFIFYIDKNLYKKTIYIYSELYDLTYPKFQKDTKFIIVSPTVIKKLKRFKHAFPAEYLLKVKSIRHTLQQLTLAKEIKSITEYKHLIHKFSKKYTKLYQQILPLAKGSYSFTSRLPIDAVQTEKFEIDLVDHFKEEIASFPSKYFLHQENIPKLKEFIEQSSILEYIDEYAPHEIYQSIIKKYNIKHLDFNFYNKHSKL